MINSRKMRDVRFGLIHRGLLLLPSEVIGDLKINSNQKNLDINENTNMVNKMSASSRGPPAMSLLNTMFDTVRLSNEELTLMDETAGAADTEMENRKPYLKPLQALKLLSSSSTKIRIVLFAVVLKGNF